MTRRSNLLLAFGAGALSMLLAGIAFVFVITPPAPSALPEMYSTSTAETAGDRPLPRKISASAAHAIAPPSTPRASSRLLIPVQGVAAASLVDTYEEARGEGRRHDAIDIVAPHGTPVLAAADGVVMKLFGSELGGTTLYQLGTDRRTIYYYAHLDRYASGILEGRVLRRGEVLGYVGTTGSAAPGDPHLHFEVSTTEDPNRYWGGTPQNPYPLLQ
jgi:peptidoglycan LD-endopeptidase LytH